MFELVHMAASSFPRVALYFENSILAPDLPLLATASSTVTRMDQAGEALMVDSRDGVGISRSILPWNNVMAASRPPAVINGAAINVTAVINVDGHPWPFMDDSTLWLPPGLHTIERAAKPPPFRVLDFNGDLKSAASVPGGVEFKYQSSARALVKLERTPRRIVIDGVEAHPKGLDNVLLLPRGVHSVTISE